MRHDRKRYLRKKRAELATWWSRQFILRVALGVFLGNALGLLAFALIV